MQNVKIIKHSEMPLSSLSTMNVEGQMENLRVRNKDNLSLTFL